MSAIHARILEAARGYLRTKESGEAGKTCFLCNALRGGADDLKEGHDAGSQEIDDLYFALYDLIDFVAERLNGAGTVESYLASNGLPCYFDDALKFRLALLAEMETTFGDEE